MKEVIVFNKPFNLTIFVKNVSSNFNENLNLTNINKGKKQGNALSVKRKQLISRIERYVISVLSRGKSAQNVTIVLRKKKSIKQMTRVKNRSRKQSKIKIY